MRNFVTIVQLSLFLTIVLWQSNKEVQAQESVIWDTVNTGSVSLVVSNHGSFGLNGIGGANMDYTSSGKDCDPTADVYLYSGGLVIIEKIDSAAGVFGMSTGLYQIDAGESFSFKPDLSGPLSSHFIGPDGSDAFYTGRFLNWDSTIGIEQTYFAPTTGAPNDDFIIIKTVFRSNDGMDHSNLMIGDVIDWNAPSDVSANNTAGIFEGTVYLQGWDTASVSGCLFNSNRFAASRLLGLVDSIELSGDECANRDIEYGTYASDNTGNNLETLGSPNGVLDSVLAWNFGSSLTGQWALAGYDTTMDQRINMTYLHNYTLRAGNPLTVYTALTTVLNGTVADLDANVVNASAWYGNNLRNGCDLIGCCEGSVGNIDGEGGVDIADLSFLIDHLFINFPPVPCFEEANVDNADGIDIGDLTFLIDYMFLNVGAPLPDCP